MQQIISTDQLQSVLKFLLILDLSLKDFLFMQSYIAELVKFYPNITFDLWINSNCRCLLGHKQSFMGKLFIELLKECNFIDNIYFNTCSSKLFKKNIQQAREFKYPYVIIFSKKNLCENIKLVRLLNPKCFLIGPHVNTKWYNFLKRSKYKFLSIRFNCKSELLSDLYKDIFEQIFGIVNHNAVINIPRKWITYAKLKFMKWGIDKRGQRFGKVFFINAFNDKEENGWQLENVLSVIKNLKKDDQWGDINFVLHVPPKKLKMARAFFAKHSINNLYMFSADNNFYQMPSILSLCDGILSVDGICFELSILLNIKNLNYMRNQIR